MYGVIFLSNAYARLDLWLLLITKSDGLYDPKSDWPNLPLDMHMWKQKEKVIFTQTFVKEIKV